LPESHQLLHLAATILVSLAITLIMTPAAYSKSGKSLACFFPQVVANLASSPVATRQPRYLHHQSVVLNDWGCLEFAEVTVRYLRMQQERQPRDP
jgi:hypothetical protein